MLSIEIFSTGVQPEKAHRMIKLARHTVAGKASPRGSTSPGRTRRKRLAQQLTFIIFIFAVSLTTTVAAGHFFVNRFATTSQPRLTINQLLGQDHIWSLVSVAIALTILLAGPGLYIKSQLTGSTSTGDGHTDTRHPHGVGDAREYHRSKQVIRMKRSAERLTAVEDNLIRRLATTDIDRVTYDLITQMQICTNRLNKQIGEFAEDDEEIVVTR